MVNASEIEQGSIVWIISPDPRGQNIKNRAFVVLTATPAIRAGDPLICVAISGTFREPLDPIMVPMRWNSAGTTETGLRKKCVAICDWVRVFHAAKDAGKIEYDGAYHGKRVRKIELLKILERVEWHRHNRKS